MEILTIQNFFEIDHGSGYGDGYGCGSGYGYGCGSGSGSGSGYGYGDGDGYGIKTYNGKPVWLIDDVQTILTSVFGDIAKGYILQKDLTLVPCYVAKQGSYFAHGATLQEAIAAVADKLFDDTPEKERIAKFWKCHEKGVKYPASDLYDWHHRLTGSCEMGRKTFAAEHGINLGEDMFTVEEFVKLCENSYGGKTIRKLM